MILFAVFLGISLVDLPNLFSAVQTGSNVQLRICVWILIIQSWVVFFVMCHTFYVMRHFPHTKQDTISQTETYLQLFFYFAYAAGTTILFVWLLGLFSLPEVAGVFILLDVAEILFTFAMLSVLYLLQKIAKTQLQQQISQ